jgi:hypothetical protein
MIKHLKYLQLNSVAYKFIITHLKKHSEYIFSKLSLACFAIRIVISLMKTDKLKYQNNGRCLKKSCRELLKKYIPLASELLLSLLSSWKTWRSFKHSDILNINKRHKRDHMPNVNVASSSLLQDRVKCYLRIATTASAGCKTIFLLALLNE